MPDPLIELLRQDKRYRFEAYVFLFESLRYAHENLGLGTPAESEPGPEGVPEPRRGEPHRHVTGQALGAAARLYALEQYGLMARTVLESWGVRSTSDFGEIVFNMIRVGRMRKTAEDRREDFDNVYDFDTAFRRDFTQTLPPQDSG